LTDTEKLVKSVDSFVKFSKEKKFFLEQATKAERGSRGIALLFH
jgi:hypothetical protein